LKALRGNPGKRPLNRNEPKPEGGAPRCPRHLEGEALAEWGRLEGELDRLGLLTELDRSLFAAYCQTWGDYVEAVDRVRGEGAVVAGAKGTPIKSPWARIKDDAVEQLLKIAPHFGLSPFTRARLDVPLPEGPDPFEEFLASGRLPRSEG
jgi:P27 family predicted phage terminase small subunit